MSYREQDGQVIPVWKRRSSRLYYHNGDRHNAFVFGAPQWYMWAWYIAWRGGSKAGVEHSFYAAKKRASDEILLVNAGRSVEVQR